MALTQTEYISLAAIGISALSALYARWAVNEAKKANEIALHIHKVKIYEEIISFSDCFRGLFSVPSAKRLEQFKKDAVQKSEIYLSEDVHNKLKEIYKHCDESEIWLSIADGEQESEQIPSSLEVRQEYKSVLNQLYPVIESIKNEAKIKNA